jgi:serine/threonine-protein kinase HipA
MIKLDVWLTIDPRIPLQAGELVVADPDPQGRLLGQFRYSPAYLAQPTAIALDPVNLPLSATVYDAARPHSGVHGVFEDSLPDDWGRRLLVRRHNLPRQQQRVPQLLRAIGAGAMGALAYGEGGGPLQLPSSTESRHLEKIEHLARGFEADPLFVDEEAVLLFQAASSPGGARPKALVHDQDHAYLAKFSSVKDTLDVVSLEAATMYLAGLAGLDVPNSHCRSFGNRKILLVERFDLDQLTQKRSHCLSMQSLLRADGYYNLAYSDMAAVVRMVAADPARDLRQLFRQMVFNLLIGNTDDHLKNFSMLNAGNGWRLSPAYDLVPNIGGNSEHVLRIGGDHHIPGRSALVAEGKHFGIKQKKEVEREIDTVFDTVTTWRQAFDRFDVPEPDARIIGKDIEARLKQASVPCLNS